LKENCCAAAQQFSLNVFCLKETRCAAAQWVSFKRASLSLGSLVCISLYDFHQNFIIVQMSSNEFSLQHLLRFDEPAVPAATVQQQQQKPQSAQSIVDHYDNEMMGGPIVVKQEPIVAAAATQQQQQHRRKKEKRAALEPPTETLYPTMVGEDPRVTTIVDLSSAGNAARLYRNHLQNIGRNADEIIARIPKHHEVMAHLAAMESPEQPLGFMELMKTPISMGLQMPRLEAVSFDYNEQFLRPPDKGNPWERPCKPLINKKTGQPFVCESVAMGGAVLREYLLPSQLSALMQSSFFQQHGAAKKTLNLPLLQRCCYLCSQRESTEAFNQQRLPNEDPSATGGGAEAPPVAEYVIIHDYIHVVGCNGGYNTLLMLPAFKHFYGVIGPLIGHDRNHYAGPTKEGGWIQKDVLRFRDGVMMLH
jgi:hypothetical protein